MKLTEFSGPPKVCGFPHDFDFDPTYGYSFNDLSNVEAPENIPSDYAEFWTSLRNKVLKTPLRIQVRQQAVEWECDDRYELSVIEYSSVGGARIGAWLVEPRDRNAIQKAIVVGHGYGGRDAAEKVPGMALDTVMLFPSARGFRYSTDSIFSQDRYEHHVLAGLESRDSYIHGGCVADFMAGVSAVLQMYPNVAGRIGYTGSSFGGGIGAFMLAWEDRVSRAAIDLPSFGNHPLRVTFPCGGSGKFIRRRYLNDESVLDVLAYFDAATSAGYISIPILVGCSLFDPAVPPPGQFSVYNAIQDKRKLLHIIPTGHFDHSGYLQEREQYEKSLKMFLEKL